MMQTDIPTTVLSNPYLLVALTIAVLALVAWQRTLSYSEYRTAHLVKSYVFLVANAWATRHGRPLIRVKADPENDPEYVRTVTDSPSSVFRVLRSNGFEPHLVATSKRRAGEFAHSQLVKFHAGGQQTEVYLFESDGRTDVYAHVETATTNPDGHLTDPQTSGDALGAVHAALPAA